MKAAAQAGSTRGPPVALACGSALPPGLPRAPSGPPVASSALKPPPPAHEAETTKAETAHGSSPPMAPSVVKPPPVREAAPKTPQAKTPQAETPKAAALAPAPAPKAGGGACQSMLEQIASKAQARLDRAAAAAAAAEAEAAIVTKTDAAASAAAGGAVSQPAAAKRAPTVCPLPPTDSHFVSPRFFSRLH